MKVNNSKMIIFLVIMFSLTFTLADYSLDINDLKTKSYSAGETLTFTPILLDNQKKINQNLEITIYDIQETKNIQKSIPSNQKQNILLKEDFPSGLWIIKATYKNESLSL